MVTIGINSKKYYFYLIGLYLSIILAIFSTIAKSIALKNFFDEGGFMGDDDDDDDDVIHNYSKNQYKENDIILNMLFFLFIFIYYLMDWILTIVLCCYLSKVKNFCSENIQNENLNSLIYQNNYNNTQNFNNNNNFTQTNIPNNQNLNSPVQPYYQI